MSFSVISSGRPPSSATMLAPNERLQRREAIELVEHDSRSASRLSSITTRYAVAVALVAQIGDAVDLLFAHQLGDALDHRGLVHLIGNFGDDDRLAFLADRLDRDLAAHDDRAAAGLVGAADAGAAENDAAGREIRAGTIAIRSSMLRAGSPISATQASITSPRLCGGMLVAMPTAMPPAPLTSRLGKRAGSTTGSRSLPS